MFEPLLDYSKELSLKLEASTLKRDRLRKLERKLSRRIGGGGNKKWEHLKNTLQIIPFGNSVEEVNAKIQARIQKFLDDQKIPLRAYKELPSGKWKEYEVGRLEFKVDATILKLANFLQFLQRPEMAIRIERLIVSYVRNRDYQLRATVRVNVLFMGDLLEKEGLEK